VADRRYRDDEEAIQIALFRYGVIAELVECPREDLGPGDVVRLVSEIASRTHYQPGHGPRTVRERTVYSWAKRFREGGIEALRPLRRKDRGTRRHLDDDVLERAIELRRELPRRHTKTLIDILEHEGLLDGKPTPHRATLDRHLRRHGASRRQMRILGPAPTIKMKVAGFGALWVGDYHHGPLVRGPGDRVCTAKLGAFLDHATRYPLADRYYLSEQLYTLRDTLRRVLLRWGTWEGKVYVDRGSVYRAEQLKYSLRCLPDGPVLVHSRPYYSQGRGVVERWWQVATAFEAEVEAREELLTIDELNRLWEAYRELRYCQEVHSELGRTPAEAIADVTPRPLDPEIVRELFLVKATRTVHKKDACVSVEGRRFRCDGMLRGRRVEVRYDPADLDAGVVIFVESERVQRAFEQQVNEPPAPPPAEEPARPVTDYLTMLREDFDQRLLAHAKPLAYAELKVEPGFDRPAFVAVVQSLAGLPLRPADERELRGFWESYGPLPEDLVRIGVEHAVRLHGRRRHVRVYLHALRTLVLAHLKTPENDR
jgi:hypothetical protein